MRGSTLKQATQLESERDDLERESDAAFDVDDWDDNEISAIAESIDYAMTDLSKASQSLLQIERMFFEQKKRS